MSRKDEFTESSLSWGELSNTQDNVGPYIGLGIGALIIGGIAAVMALIKGHSIMYNMSQNIPWTLLIATYAFFVLTASGLAFIGGLGHAFGHEPFRKISKRITVMAFAVLLAGFTQIAMDLGHPLKLGIYMLVSPNFSAPIAWMGLFYTIELIILVLELYLMFRSKKEETESKMVGLLGLLAMVFGLLAAGTLGYVFSSNSARPFFNGIYMSTSFVVSGICSGAALLILVHNLLYRFRIPPILNNTMQSLGKLMGICIGVMIFLYLWKILTSLSNSGSLDPSFLAISAMLSGPLSGNFWVGEILLAILLPLILIAVTGARSTGALGLSSLIFLIGFFFTKYDIIIAGQLPAVRGGVVGYDSQQALTLSTYFPAVGEWMIFVLGFGVFFTLYFIAEKILDLRGETTH